MLRYWESLTNPLMCHLMAAANDGPHVPPSRYPSTRPEQGFHSTSRSGYLPSRELNESIPFDRRLPSSRAACAGPDRPRYRKKIVHFRRPALMPMTQG
jgi:hypothetical protein